LWASLLEPLLIDFSLHFQAESFPSPDDPKFVSMLLQAGVEARQFASSPFETDYHRVLSPNSLFCLFELESCTFSERAAVGELVASDFSSHGFVLLGMHAHHLGLQEYAADFYRMAVILEPFLPLANMVHFFSMLHPVEKLFWNFYLGETSGTFPLPINPFRLSEDLLPCHAIGNIRYANAQMCRDYDATPPLIMGKLALCRNHEQALYYFTQAAKRGSAEALFFKGRLEESREVREKDVMNAANTGFIPAQLSVARNYLIQAKTETTAKDRKRVLLKAESWLTKLSLSFSSPSPYWYETVAAAYDLLRLSLYREKTENVEIYRQILKSLFSFSL
jgi:hypothetical protein